VVPAHACPAATARIGGQRAQSFENEVKYDLLLLESSEILLDLKPVCNDSKVKGSLYRNKNWWLRNAFDFWAVDTVINGYVLPFFSLPPAAELQNNKSVKDNMTFVIESINELITSGRVIEVSEKPMVVNPLTVAISGSGKLRLVLDLRHVNPHLWKSKCKYEGTDILLTYLEKNDFLISFDLKSGYHHIDICERNRTFLGFSVSIKNIKKYFVYTVLPFGLSTAGSVFTRMMNCVVRHLRMSGLKLVVYLDDGICVANSHEQAANNAHIIQSTLNDAGFVVNKEKSKFEPSQALQWLGFLFDTHNCRIRVPADKLSRVHDFLLCCSTLSRPSTRELAAMVGKITAMHLAFGNIVFLKTKFCQKEISKRISWDQRASWQIQCKAELEFWTKNLFSIKTKNPFQCISFGRIVYSDASNMGCGGFIVAMNGSETFIPWAKDEINSSSTWKELNAVFLLCNALKDSLKGHKVKWYTDNANVGNIICKGSMVNDLQQLALKIHNFCIENNCELFVEWIPREKNDKADALSRFGDVDDWSVEEHIFSFASKRWGPFTCDVFANHINRKLEKFYSKFWCPETAGVDAFAFEWKDEVCWVVLPIALLSKVIKKLKEEKCKGALVFPLWKKAAFWPLLFHGDQLDSMIKDMIVYSKPKHFFKKGSSDKSVFAREQFMSDVALCYFDANY
jgi:hypothetical protein